MNERIEELAVQSKLGSAEFGNGVQYYVATQETFEKFTELIVRECISCVGSQADKAYLKKHFGLPVESDIVYPATDESWSVETQYKRKYNIAPGRDMGGI